jgi:hypothetical protein
MPGTLGGLLVVARRGSVDVNVCVVMMMVDDIQH